MLFVLAWLLWWLNLDGDEIKDGDFEGKESLQSLKKEDEQPTRQLVEEESVSSENVASDEQANVSFFEDDTNPVSLSSELKRQLIEEEIATSDKVASDQRANVSVLHFEDDTNSVSLSSDPKRQLIEEEIATNENVASDEQANVSVFHFEYDTNTVSLSSLENENNLNNSKNSDDFIHCDANDEHVELKKAQLLSQLSFKKDRGDVKKIQRSSESPFHSLPVKTDESVTNTADVYLERNNEKILSNAKNNSDRHYVSDLNLLVDGRHQDHVKNVACVESDVTVVPVTLQLNSNKLDQTSLEDDEVNALIGDGQITELVEDDMHYIALHGTRVNIKTEPTSRIHSIVVKDTTKAKIRCTSPRVRAVSPRARVTSAASPVHIHQHVDDAPDHDMVHLVVQTQKQQTHSDSENLEIPDELLYNVPPYNEQVEEIIAPEVFESVVETGNPDFSMLDDTVHGSSATKDPTINHVGVSNPGNTTHGNSAAKDPTINHVGVSNAGNTTHGNSTAKAPTTNHVGVSNAGNTTHGNSAKKDPSINHAVDSNGKNIKENENVGKLQTRKGQKRPPIQLEQPSTETTDFDKIMQRRKKYVDTIDNTGRMLGQLANRDSKLRGGVPKNISKNWMKVKEAVKKKQYLSFKDKAMRKTSSN